MTDYEILKSWLVKAKANFTESKCAYDDTPIIIIWTSNQNDSNVSFYFNADGSFCDFENINDYEN